MVNPNLIKLAKRQMNKEVPTARPKTQNYESELIQILERDEDGKPKLDLTPIEETAVNTPTQEQYDTLMQVYECGGWRWNEGDLPTQYNCWGKYKEETCTEEGISLNSRKKREFGYAERELYQGKNWNILTPQQFYDTQNVTPEMINKINDWFDKNGK